MVKKLGQQFAELCPNRVSAVEIAYRSPFIFVIGKPVVQTDLVPGKLLHMQSDKVLDDLVVIETNDA